MEDALKWGVEHIFSRHRYPTQHASDTDTNMAGTSRPALAATPGSSPSDVKMEAAASPRSPSHAQEAATPVASAAAEATASPHSTPASASPESSMQSPFGAPEQQQPQHRSNSKIKGSHKHSSSAFQPLYTDGVVDKLVQWSASLPVLHVQAEPSGQGNNDQAMHEAVDKAADRARQSLGKVLGPGWDCVKVHEWSQAQMDDDTHGDEGELSDFLCMLYAAIAFVDCDSINVGALRQVAAC